MVRTLAWESEAGGFAAGCSGYERTAEPGCCGSGVTGCKDLTTVQNSEGHRADGCHYRVLLSSSLPWIWVQLTGLQDKSYFSFLALVVSLPLRIQSTDPSLMATACSRF